ncbi:MAG: EI24 domain-containing protein [Candidatus Brocadiia bacterium]
MQPRGVISAPVRFARGLGYPFRAARLLLSERRLALTAIAPFLICLVLYAVALTAALVFVDDVVGLMIQPGAWWRTVVRVVLTVSLGLGFFLALVFTYTAVCMAVAAPFYEVLSAGVERRLAGQVEEEPFSLLGLLNDLWRVVRLTALLLALEVVVLLLGVLLVPVTTVVAFGLSGVLLSLEFTDPPMERRRMRIRRRLRFARRNLWEMMGLGVVLMLLLGIPFVGAVFLPLGVVGGTILFVEAEAGIAGG